jgi:RNA polymerase sigma-70 factor, ECF subfamily
MAMVDGQMQQLDGAPLARGPCPEMALSAAAAKTSATAADEAQEFLSVYDTYVDFVWRMARRLGVEVGSVDDVVQETFLVVHRRLGESHVHSLRGWIYGIVISVVRNHRRTLRRKSPHMAAPESSIDPDDLADRSTGPFDATQQAEATRLLHELLAKLDDEKREVFVLVELEELTVPEVAEALSINLNTVSSRLRLARAEFEEAARRSRARDEWRLK